MTTGFSLKQDASYQKPADYEKQINTHKERREKCVV
jgi:hypothetical protein